MEIWLLQDEQWSRPVILAQVTLSRLGETCSGQTLARARALAQVEGLSLSEAPSRQARHARLSENAWELEVCRCNSA